MKNIIFLSTIFISRTHNIIVARRTLLKKRSKSKLVQYMRALEKAKQT